MDVTVTFRKKTRCHKAWIIRGYVYLRSTFAKCCWKRQASRFASATSVLIYSSLSDRPTRLDHSLDGICPLPGLFLPELAVSQLPHTKVGTTAAPGTFCTQRMGKLQMPWGQDPFTDCEAAWLVLTEGKSQKQVAILLRKGCDTGLSWSELGLPSPPKQSSPFCSGVCSWHTQPQMLLLLLPLLQQPPTEMLSWCIPHHPLNSSPFPMVEVSPVNWCSLWPQIGTNNFMSSCARRSRTMRERLECVV